MSSSLLFRDLRDQVTPAAVKSLGQRLMVEALAPSVMCVTNA